MVKIRSRYNLGEVQAGTVNSEPSMTSQEFKQDTDIYWILSRFTEAYADKMNPENFVYSDWDKNEDFEYWQNKIVEVKEQFYGLTVKQRAHFGNSIAEFHKFCGDINNFYEGVKLGIFEPNRDDFGNVLPDDYQRKPGMTMPVPEPIPPNPNPNPEG